MKACCEHPEFIKECHRHIVKAAGKLEGEMDSILDSRGKNHLNETLISTHLEALRTVVYATAALQQICEREKDKLQGTGLDTFVEAWFTELPPEQVKEQIELVENLLALTKIEDGSVKLQLSDQVVEDVVREALRHVERRKNEHEITVDCGEDVLLARMDAKLIVQVLVNLINNAVKYTQAGSKIRITAGKEEKNVWIAVEDNGPGIPAECREHVFEMFYSGKNKVSDSRRSLGLGLALCRSIVNAHGGDLVLRDCAPHGCHFRFTLPLSEVNLNE